MIDRCLLLWARIAALGLALVVVPGLLICPSGASAQNVPVRFYISPNDDGTGGSPIHLIATGEGGFGLPANVTYSLWADPSSAAGGQGIFSIQDLLIGLVDAEYLGDEAFPFSVIFTGFSCSAPACETGPRPDPARDVFLALGDDTSPTPTLTAPFRVGDLTIRGAYDGTVRILSGTALDADGLGAPLEIEGLPNEGALIQFVPGLPAPEPLASAQLLAGGALLLCLARGRRHTRAKRER